MAEPSAGKIRVVGDIMSHPAVTATASETIAVVAARMRAKKVGSVVVVDGNRPTGILTERDLVKIAASGIDSSAAKVSEWMSPDPDTVTADMGVVAAFNSLSEHGYRHIPVVKAAELVGLVSMRDIMKVAQIQPASALAQDVPRGLEGVVVAETEIGDVRGMEGFYHYRQYNAAELAAKRSLEDIWHLLFEGTLPTKAEHASFVDEIRPLREIPEDVMAVIPSIARAGGEAFAPLIALRTAYSLMAGSMGMKPSMDIDAIELRAQGMRTCAVIPTLLMALYRSHQGLEPIAPHPDLAYAANYLYMLTGEVPTAQHARAIEQYLISTIDHGFNSSTFTARVITSTGADLGSAVCGAIGALSGPLHGGAPSRALDMLDDIGDTENAEPWIRAAIERGDRLMGFGHRIYKTDDPRSLMLRSVAEGLGGPKVVLAEHIEKTAIAVLAELKPGRKLYTNVEFYAGLVMDAVGVPRELFTPTFASSRVIGWTAHVLEQAADNRLIRPSAHYTGPPPPVPVPDAE